jgi:hypothetical protein
MLGTKVVYDAVQRAPFAGTAPGESAADRAV